MADTLHWSNWSGAVKSRPRVIVKPHDLNELVKLIKSYGREGRRVRVVGAGHSFTPIARSDDVLLSLDEMQGVESIDTENNTATIWGGTKLKALSESLYARGLAQEN